MVLIVPQGADELLQVLKEHMQDWVGCSPEGEADADPMGAGGNDGIQANMSSVGIVLGDVSVVNPQTVDQQLMDQDDTILSQG